jgi:hypothetical protein
MLPRRRFVATATCTLARARLHAHGQSCIGTSAGTCRRSCIRIHRPLVEVTPNFPEECRLVLEQLGQVYRNDARAREQGLTPEERLRFHQLYSGAVMDQLHVWLTTQFAEKKLEPNSGLGVAIRYLLKHWQRLTLFLRQLGAPLVPNGLLR